MPRAKSKTYFVYPTANTELQIETTKLTILAIISTVFFSNCATPVINDAIPVTSPANSEKITSGFHMYHLFP